MWPMIIYGYFVYNSNDDKDNDYYQLNLTDMVSLSDILSNRTDDNLYILVTDMCNFDYFITVFKIT